MRSFHSLWYWILVGWVWFGATNVVLGVPQDLIRRAMREDGTAMADVEAIAGINAARVVDFIDAGGLWLLALGSFVLTSLVLLAFLYGVELAQALAMIVLPMTVVLELRARLARRIVGGRPQGEALIRQIVRHRMATQTIGMVAVLLTALVGVWRMLAAMTL